MSRSLVLRTTTLLAVSGMAAAGAFVPSSAGASAPAVKRADASAARVVAAGLNNPRHLVFRGGTLYVAEAGKGGARNCAPDPEDPSAQVCYGATGSIMRLGKHPRRILTGLPSIASKDSGNTALGPSGITTVGGRLAFTVGGGGTPAHRATLPASGRKIGTLVLASHRGRSWKRHSLRIVADLMRFEARHDPDGQGPDSDPTGLIRHNGHFLTTDSGGNDLLRAGGRAGTRVISVFGNRTVPNPFGGPPVSMDPVPTAVAVGPHALFVSELTGFPFPQGAARIFRVVPGHAPTVWATGLTNVTDLTWYRGSLYAVQISNVGLAAEHGLPVGSLVKVHHGASHSQVGHNLTAPYGVAMHRGAAFLTTCAVCAGGGKVVRMQLP